MTRQYFNKVLERKVARFDADTEAARAFAEMDRAYPTWRRYASTMADVADSVSSEHRGFEGYRELLHAAMLVRPNEELPAGHGGH